MLPEQMTTVLAIDPASSDSKDADDNVVAVLGFHRDNVYIVDYVAATGQTPEMVTKTVFEFVRRYRPLGVVVESIGYQRVLAWFLEKSMREQKVFLPVYQVQDKRRKADRIVQALGGLSAYGKLRCLPKHLKFLEQFTEYSPTYGGHDDVLDAVAMGITWGNNQSAGDWLEGDYTEVPDEDEFPKLKFRAAP
jgi:phage terminase large subunit-like protein